MLKKLNKYETQHILNVRKVEKIIDRHFYKACQDTAFLTYGLDARLSDDALFSFADYPYLTRRLNKILDTLKNRTFMTVVSGIKASWDLSKTKNDNLVHSLFGEGVDAARFNRYYSTRTGAVNAFIKRVDNGLSLSDKVWKYTERFKNEIELGIDCGLRDGLSAPEIARSLKMYLQYPDKLFRRVRTQHGILKLSKTAAAFHPGQGVYRSSYKNARRLAATETNIAYRTADFERWQDFDFVVGIEIKLSNNHTLNGKPFTDICDKLAGKYPKDFKFVGWHPLCRCHVLSILKTPKEIAEDMKRERQGLPPISSEDSTNAITSLPDNFNDWASANSDRIQRATRRGTLPYFIGDNFIINQNGTLFPLTGYSTHSEKLKAFKIKAIDMLHGKTFRDGITISNSGIKEWLNQPHIERNIKDRALFNIENLLQNAEYKGCGIDKHSSKVIAHLYEILLGSHKSWIIVREFNWGKQLHSISDKKTLLQKIKNPSNK